MGLLNYSILRNYLYDNRYEDEDDLCSILRFRRSQTFLDGIFG